MKSHKLHIIILLSLTTTIVGCRNGSSLFDEAPPGARIQNIEAASKLKIGMSPDEVKKVMGESPIRSDKEGNTVVWQYCKTKYKRSEYVALFFAKETERLESTNNYTIYWEEIKDKKHDLDFGDVVVKPSEYQLSCNYIAQKMGVKDPNNIVIWFTQYDLENERNHGHGYSYNNDQAENIKQQQEQQMRQIEQHNAVNHR